MKRHAIHAFAAASLLIGGSWLLAGPLNPPAGPVAPTGKTLADVEPRIAISDANTPGDADSMFRITQRGSYYLTGNVTATLFMAKNGIEIATSGVTIDLNGFELNGSTGTSGYDGVTVTATTPRNITVRNGIVRGWGDDSVDLLNVTGGRLERITASENRGNGMNAGKGFAVETCTATENDGIGIFAYNGSVISGCAAAYNGGSGINIFASGAVRSCSATNNDDRGIVAGEYSVVEGCSASLNTTYGISTGGSCLIRGNQSSQNGSAGIRTIFGSSRVEENNCVSNGTGIEIVDSGNFIARNICAGIDTNWSIAANNKCLVVQAANAAAFSGDSGGASPGSTNPNANFTY